MGRLLLVAAGGALGSALRYMVATAALGWLGPAFPWGTLAVNLVGSFLIGLVQQLATEAFVLGEETRLFLTTGVMGGLRPTRRSATRRCGSSRRAPPGRAGSTWW